MCFFPEQTPGGKYDYAKERQYEWEDFHLRVASCILFWIPRDLKMLPGFTTNIEWGKWCGSGKVILGHPPNAPKTSWIDFDAQRHFVTVEENLGDAVQAAIAMSERLAQRARSGIRLDSKSDQRGSIPRHPAK